MVANELRIGNYYIGYDNAVYTVDLNLFERINNGIFLDEIIKEPIILTEEILLKCGFVDNIPGRTVISMDNSYYLKVSPTNPCLKVPNYEEYLSFNYSGYGKSIRLFNVNFYGECLYIHQLQNLYFALTGKELEINL